MFILINFFVCFSLFAIETLGTQTHPFTFAMVPGQDSVVLEENGKIIQKCLESETKFFYKLVIPNNFISVVESIGTKRVDIALMNTYGYILAHQKFNAHAYLIGTFRGQSEYWGQIISKQDGPSTLKELNDKTFAFVDPASTSGFILPQKELAHENVKLKSTLFAGKHDTVVSMVYQGRVDAGATYHTKPVDGVPQDARTLVQTQYPDVFSKVKILKVIGPIPSDPIVFGAHVESVQINQIVSALKKCVLIDNVKNAFMKSYHLDGLKDASDQDWKSFTEDLKITY